MRLHIYTDGSCWPNPGPEGGWSALIVPPATSVAIVFGRVHGTNVTNNQMELRAILEGLRLIPDIVTPRHKIVVYSDSEWSIRVLSGEYRARANTGLITQCTQHLQRLGYRSGFTCLEHVRGHRGEPHNELADEIAGGGATSIPLSPWRGRRVHVVSRGDLDSGGLGASCPEGLIVDSWTSLTAKERARFAFLSQ